MIKKHERVRKGWMRRTSRIYITNTVNKGKIESLIRFLNQYQNAINYCVQRFWSNKDFTDELATKEITDAIGERFGFTARLSQCVAKQSKEMVNSQREKSRKERRIPRMKHRVANLDSRFVTIENFDGHFDMCLKFTSGVPQIVMPFNWTGHTDKFRNNGWELAKSIRLGYNENGLFVDLIFEKERPPKRTEGKLIGIDRGYNCMLHTSDGQKIGKELKPKIKSVDKRRKTYHHYIETEENRLLKKLNLDDVKIVVLESLKYVKMNKRGKFPRNTNRLLSFWHYAKVGNRLAQICEELGVSEELKNPYKTSQRCPDCGNIDRRNRRGERFLCLSCGYADDADHVGAKNLELLGLAGVYSLRSLPSDFMEVRNERL